MTSCLGSAPFRRADHANERYASIRGFDRFQTTLSIDGVRVFLPADNRVDLARFLTADLSQVQVAKGYVSVLDGPGAMGGAINLVTRRPTQAFEGEVGVGVEFDNRLQTARHAVTARVGGASQRGYAQISGVYAERGHWSLPRGFEATTLEDGGRRDFSDTVDWRINLITAEVALTPAVDLIFGARNLFDATYMLTDGYPEAGRSVRLDLKARF
ncbi:TonB-dependent receptor plug domain-containing protein [Brevundimonas vancanneytii]|uniref:Catecholate siderophore receptor CirA n=1 Tax=Brevundimonas vancanneytii TaxID=1325724 RepID=A0A4P1K3D6_9CAUL|nr:TonB-dependent receptor plug domain-containing protein [Brevundimonas vancanneytii]VTO14321.1 catecholate siderophore receptor CirA [Brevundimonas vancanneytii]